VWCRSTADLAIQSSLLTVSPDSQALQLAVQVGFQLAMVRDAGHGIGGG